MPRSRRKDGLRDSNPRSPELKPRPDEWASRTVPIFATGFETPIDRTPQSQHDIPTGPQFLNHGRNNLTALSQQHNLFFLAFRDRVQVFQPRFPHQKLGCVPSLELPPQPSRRGTRVRPSMNQYQPKGINNLICGDLGDQEILVLARDDGDILAYHVAKILDEIERREDNEQGPVCHDMRPFFHQCIGSSAWGLSIHREARMIAASCNLYTVSVFAFALAAATPEDDRQPLQTPGADSQPAAAESEDLLRDHEEAGLERLFAEMTVPPSELDEFKDLLALDSDWVEYTGKPPHRPDLFRSRRRNFRVLLLGIRSNIPAISFCNTGDDPTGRYIIATGINGTTMIWSIEGRQIVRTLTPNGYAGDFDRLRGGWGALWLPKDSFFPTRVPAEALGTKRVVRMSLPQYDMMILNTSSARERMQQNKFWNPFARRAPGDQGEADHTDDMNARGPPNERNMVQLDENEGFEITHENPLLGLERPAPIDMPTEDGPLPDLGQRRRMDQLEARVTYLHAHWPLVTMHPTTSHGAIDPELIYSQFSCPLLLFTSQHVHLIQHGRFEAMNLTSPTISMYDPLEQSLVDANQLHGLEIFDRMNLVAQIPELGVVVAGSGKGRVAIFSLHALEHNPFSPTSTEPIRTMRLNHILPTADQEDAGQRPLSLLVGVAASPVQGARASRFGGTLSSARRWRLMLTYLDLTVLSYEIGHLGGQGVEIIV